MTLGTINLVNFRNFESLKIEVHPHFNLIIGKNAQGKTNLLESVYYVSFLNSFRSSNRQELIGPWGAEAGINAEFETDGVKDSVSIVLSPTSKSVKLNGKKPPSFTDYFGRLPVLLFEPRDVYLFRDSPSQRRKYLGRALFLDNVSMAKLQRDYDEVVSQKNRLLKTEGSYSKAQVAVWNAKLVEFGSSIILKRLKWLDEVNRVIAGEYQNISGGAPEVELRYVSKVKLEGIRDESIIRQNLAEMLEIRSAEELKRSESLVGPHRDDFVAMINGKSVDTYGSQGENRSLIIALKAVQIMSFADKHGYPPVFLLDDVASELDSKRTEALFHYLARSRSQAFLTATDVTEDLGDLQQDGQTFMIDNGKVRVLTS